MLGRRAGVLTFLLDLKSAGFHELIIDLRQPVVKKNRAESPRIVFKFAAAIGAILVANTGF